jgi:parallel beta-helix repeat protein
MLTDSRKKPLFLLMISITVFYASCRKENKKEFDAETGQDAVINDDIKELIEYAEKEDLNDVQESEITTDITSEPDEDASQDESAPDLPEKEIFSEFIEVKEDLAEDTGNDEKEFLEIIEEEPAEDLADDEEDFFNVTEEVADTTEDILSEDAFSEDVSDDEISAEDVFDSETEIPVNIPVIVQTPENPVTMLSKVIFSLSEPINKNHLIYWDFDKGDDPHIDAAGDEVSFVYGKSGDYTVTADIYFTDGSDAVTLQKDVTVSGKTFSPGEQKTISETAEENNPYIIEGLEFNNNKQPLQYFLFIKNAKNIIVQNCYFHDVKSKYNDPEPGENMFFTSDSAILIENSENITIRNCAFENAEGGIFAMYSKNMKIYENYFYNINRTENIRSTGAIYLNNSDSIIIRNNILNSIGHLEAMEQGCDSNDLTRAIGIEHSGNATISENHISDLVANPIYINSDYTLSPTENFTVSNNTMRNNGLFEPYILMINLKNADVSDNIIFDNRYCMGMILSVVHDSVIHNNLIIGSRAGIQIASLLNSIVAHNSIISTDKDYSGIPLPNEGIWLAYPNIGGSEPIPVKMPTSQNSLIINNVIYDYQINIQNFEDKPEFIDGNNIFITGAHFWDEYPPDYFINSVITTKDESPQIIGNNNIIIDPQFILPENHVYFPLDSSPIINKGVNGFTPGIQLKQDMDYLKDFVPVYGLKGENYLSNPGLENGEFDPWYHSPEVSIKSSTEVDGKIIMPCEGNYFAEIKGNNAEIMLGQSFPLNSKPEDTGKAFEFSGYVQTFKNNLHTGMYLKAGFLKDEDKPAGEIASTVFEIQDEKIEGYRKVTLSGVIPPGAKKVIVEFNFNGAEFKNDTALIDNASFIIYK